MYHVMIGNYYEKKNEFGFVICGGYNGRIEIFFGEYYLRGKFEDYVK